MPAEELSYGRRGQDREAPREGNEHGLPRGAKAFERKAATDGRARHQRAGRAARSRCHLRWTREHAALDDGGSFSEPARESGSMVEAVIWLFEEEDNRAMRSRELWTLIEARGLYTSLGRTPWATVASKLATDPSFERVAPASTACGVAVDLNPTKGLPFGAGRATSVCASRYPTAKETRECRGATRHAPW